MIHFVLNIQIGHGVIQNFQDKLNLCGPIGSNINNCKRKYYGNEDKLKV